MGTARSEAQIGLKTWEWDRIPSISDPRWPFAAILLTYVICGITFLGFNRTPAQIVVTVGAAVAIDMFLNFWFRGGRILFPLSAFISGLGLCVLLNFSHGLLLPLIPVFLAISSKYILTYQGRHFFNPTLFGVAMCIFFSDGMIGSAPAYQWGDTLAASFFVVTAALVFFVGKINRVPLIFSFLVFYTLATAIRAYSTIELIPAESVFFGTISAPSFYLFAFFMLTDPATSPKNSQGQILAAFGIVAIDLFLHSLHMIETLFIAAFIYAATRFLYLHGIEFWNNWRQAWGHLQLGVRKGVMIGTVYVVSHLVIAHSSQANGIFNLDFKLVKQGEIFQGRPSDLLMTETDPRVVKVAKWLASIGDATAVGDYDNDGLPDIFLSYPHKHEDDRSSLYRNLGNFKFEKVPLPALDPLRKFVKKNGASTGALWLDYDNDGDKDLFVIVAFGRSRLLQNQLIETGKATFVDVSEQTGVTDYTVSVTANALDFDRDGKLDIMVANVMTTELPGYDPPVKFNMFNLPPEEYPGDRRMYNVMNRTWYNADNGGGTYFLHNKGGRFENLGHGALGINERRWSLAIGTGDLDHDGWTDLYVANDYGPDQMYLNEKGQGFKEIKGLIVGELGKDIYKGMNSTFTDFDNNGHLDIYVSNMHQRMVAEGSMLWMNDGRVREKGYRAFNDQATARGILNEKRFGWGAASGDLNRDGWMDIVQVNGYLDDNYDRRFPECRDYWYWNMILALSPPEIHTYADNWADLRGACMFPAERNRVYLNTSTHFSDVSDELGLTDKNTARGVSLADFDNDGDLDVVIARMTLPALVYKNESHNGNSWVGLAFEGNGTTCNRDAAGTQVTVESIKDGKPFRQYREVQIANGMAAQNDMRLLFGLGKASGEVTVSIYWCGDRTKVDQRRLPVNQYHPIRQ